MKQERDLFPYSLCFFSVSFSLLTTSIQFVEKYPSHPRGIIFNLEEPLFTSDYCLRGVSPSIYDNTSVSFSLLTTSIQFV